MPKLLQPIIRLWFAPVFPMYIGMFTAVAVGVSAAVGIASTAMSLMSSGDAAAGAAASVEAMKKGAKISYQASQEQARYEKMQGDFAAKSAGYDIAKLDQQIQDKEATIAGQVSKIKQQAIYLRGNAIATQAASGVVVGKGSTRDTVDFIDRLATEDTTAIIASGDSELRALREGQRLTAEKGMYDKASADSKARSTLLKGKADLARAEAEMSQVTAAGQAAENQNTANIISGIGQIASTASSAYTAYKGK